MAFMESYKICCICFPGSHGCHVFSTEPENKSACVGACSSLQSSPETQHEETHLHGHVGKRTARPPSLTSLCQTVIRKKKNKKRVVHAHRNPGQSHLLSLLLTYLFDAPERMHASKSAHTGRQLTSHKSVTALETALCFVL